MTKKYEFPTSTVFYALVRDTKPGSRVWWGTIDGKQFKGVLQEWDSNVAIVNMEDGTQKAVEC